MRDIVLFDLDGTLANISHRRHLVENGAKQWREFYAACPGDTVNEPVVAMWHALGEWGDYDRWIVSGRSDEVKSETILWLAENGIYPDKLIMRQANDHQPDDKLKRQWLNDGTIPKDRVLCVFDDRTKVVNMWREEGLTCFQVAPGDF